MRTIRILIGILGTLAAGESAHCQCQIQKIGASDGEDGDNFGLSVAMDGSWAVLGAPFESDVAVNSGAAYVFQRTENGWVEFQKLKASDVAMNTFAGLGEEVAISGEVLVVGADEDDPQGVLNAGAVYVFELVGSSWTEVAKLTASDMTQEDYFGSSVALDGDRMLVGAENANNRGAAYVFDRVGGSWIESAKLVGNDTVGFDIFGWSVSLKGDLAMVGVPSKAGPNGSFQGAAYIFEKGKLGWAQAQKLLASDAAANNHFGQSVEIELSRAAVGAKSHSHGGVNNAGAVYYFEKVGAMWIETQELLAEDHALGKSFGVDVAFSGDRLLVGAHADDHTFWSTRGAAYDFRWDGSAWIQAGKLLAREPHSGDLLGLSVDLAGNLALVGAKSDDSACPTDPSCNSGAAYFFELGPTARQYGSCPTAAPCNNKDPHGGCRNSSGEGAVFAACGSGSVTTDDLRLEVTHCPPNKLTLLFMGPAQSSVPYGDGLRVAAPQNPTGIYRYGGAAADSIGRVMRGPGLVAHSQGFQPLGRIQSGQTWNFQFWYRDTQGPCGGLTNFSNGVEVAFGP